MKVAYSSYHQFYHAHLPGTIRYPDEHLENGIIVLATVIQKFLKAHQIASARVLVGVSGGGDSVALLRGLHALASEFDLELIVAHFNHNLRADSSEDATWVCKLCDQLKLPCEIGSATLSTGDEATARAARYAFFHQILTKHHCSALALGHTQDDQTETILHHIVRGTGLKGLAGIPQTRSLDGSTTLIRPLLHCSRKDVLLYLEETLQPYLTDPTNSQTHYTRNRIRHDLLPLIREKFNPQVDDALLRLATQANSTQAALEELAERLLNEVIVDRQPSCIRLKCDELASQPGLLVRELFNLVWKQQNWPRQKMTFKRWQELAALAMSAHTSQLSLPGPVQAVKRRKVLELSIQSER